MAMTTEQQLDSYKFFIIAFGAAPGVVYMDQLDAAYATGMTTKEAVNEYTTKPQFTAMYPQFLTNEQFATLLVNNVVKGTASDAAKAEAVVDIMGAIAGGMSRGDVIYQVFNNLTDKQDDATWGTTAQMFNNQIAVAKYYTEVLLGEATDVATLQSVVSGVTATTDTSPAGLAALPDVALASKFTLTTGVDALVGTIGNDAFTATAGQWSALDSIDGRDGNDTFTVAVDANIPVAPVGFTIANVETAKLISGGSIAVDASTWAVDTLNLTSTAGTTVTAKATTNVNELNSNAASTITGGKDVTVVHTGVATVSVQGTTGAVNVDSDEGVVNVGTVSAVKGSVTVVANDDITVAGGTTLNASIKDAVSLADRTAHEAAADAASLAVNGNDIVDGTSVVLNKAQGLAGNLANLKDAIDLGGNDTIEENNTLTLNALKSGYITMAQKQAIDTAFATALKAESGTADKAQTAALAIVTPLATAAKAAVLVASEANAAAVLANTAAQTAANDDWNVDGIGSSITATTNTALTSATASGNYYGYVNIADGSVLGKTLTTVTLDNTGNASLTGKALTNVILSNLVNGASVNVSNTTLDHTQNLTVSNSDVNFTDANAASLSIVSNGAENVVSLDANLVTAVTITGAADLQIWFEGDVAAKAVITATAATGNIETGVGADQSYLGGAGVDTVWALGATKQTATVSGGAGSADVLTVYDARALDTTGAAKFADFEVLKVSGNFQLQTVDVSKLTSSAITSVVLDGYASVTGLNATQAANITIEGSYGSMSIGVKDATINGNIDTVSIDVNDGDAAYLNSIYLGSLSLLGVETLNLTATDSISALYLNNATALTNVNVSGSGDVYIDADGLSVNVNTLIDAHAVTGDTTIDFGGYSSTNGVKIIGSDTADSNIYGVANKANVLTAGNGNNDFGGGSEDDIITSGNGNSSIYAGNGANVIKVGNGYNSIFAGVDADTITVGTGGNVIVAGAGADKITLGAHALGVSNTIVIGNTDSGKTLATADSITGFVSGADTLALGVAGVATAGATQNYVEASAAVADFSAALTAANAALATLDGTSGNTAPELYSFQFDGVNGYLFNDVDGNGSADQVIVLVGVTGATFAATDIAA